MCWPIAKSSRVAVILSTLAICLASVGCARPAGVLFASDQPRRVWPPSPESARIRWIGAIAGSDDLKAAQGARERWASAVRGPRPPIRFSGPHAVAVRGTNLVAVADSQGGNVHIFNLVERTHVVASGWNDQRLGAPVGVAWLGDLVLVSDAGRGELIVFGPDGRFRRTIAGGILDRPVGVAYVSDRQEILVGDGGANCVNGIDPDGTLLRTIGGPGVEPGAFNYPTHLCCAHNTLVVADSGNFRIQLFNLNGDFIRAIGTKGDGAGDFALPKGVALDAEGHIYVVDSHFENVQVFDLEGQLLMAFGNEGRGAGEFWLPAGLAIDEMDRIWVADSGNRRLQVFQYLRGV